MDAGARTIVDDDDDDCDCENDNDVIYDDEDEDAEDEMYDCRGPSTDTAVQAVHRATGGRREIRQNVVFDAPQRWDWIVYRWPASEGGWSVGQVTTVHRKKAVDTWEGVPVKRGHTVTYYGENTTAQHALVEANYRSSKEGGWFFLSKCI
eukprot:COSAG03_NODE_934_length_5267_cov_19.622485_6_plen_150_part_00